MMFVTKPGSGPGTGFNWTFAIVAVVALLLLGLQTWANYYRQWYDPALALKYQGMFCGKEGPPRDKAQSLDAQSPA